MQVLWRLACLTGLLMSVIAIPAAADQGRGDHDAATQRQSEFGSPQQFKSTTCRTYDDGWVICRDSRGQWRQYETRQPVRRYSQPGSVDDWIWRLLD